MALAIGVLFGYVHCPCVSENNRMRDLLWRREFFHRCMENHVEKRQVEASDVTLVDIRFR